MRRLLLALAGTAAGLAAVLSFKTQGSAATSGAMAAPQAGTQGSASAAASTGSASTGSASTGSASTGSASTSSASTSSTSPKSGGGTVAGQQGGTAAAAGAKVLTGAVDNTPYGPMQVQVTMDGSKITDVKVLQQTNTGSLSQQIDANAIPQLTKETLTAQSARIDAVSGASYTSAGYIKSLQSALDQAAG
jgi:uncharacterized protein with FMN-binding domain